MELFNKFRLSVIAWSKQVLWFSRYALRSSSVHKMTVMLVTSLCWWLYKGDWFQMFVAKSLSWRFSQCIKSVTIILNWSPTSQTCHQHIWSPTSVTNIDVTVITITIQTLNNSHGWNFQAIISGKQVFKTDKVLKSPHNIKNNEISSQHFLQPT